MQNRNEALVNLEQGSHGRSGEVISYSLYDTMSWLSTRLQYDFFTVPLGQAGKTLADTNNLLAGVMPAGQRLTVKCLKLIFLGISTMTVGLLEDFMESLFSTTLEIYQPGKDNLGVFTLAELTNMQNLITYALTQNGPYPANSDKFGLSIPIMLAANSTFKARLVHHVAPEAGIDGIKMKLVFSGILERLS